MAAGPQTRLSLFGAQPVRVDGEPRPLSISGTTERLFQFFLVHPRREWRREYLADLFWRGARSQRQRSALNSAVWRIKRQLRDIDGLELVSQGRSLRLDIAPQVDVDVEELDHAVVACARCESLDRDRVRRLRAMLERSEAPFMDGVQAEWVLAERERVFNLQIRGLTLLMHWLGEQHRYEEALEVGRRLLSADPAREAAQCAVMWLYVLNGQRAQAIRHYERFRRWLDRELGIAPMPETRALYEYIRTGLERPGAAEARPERDRPRARAAEDPGFTVMLDAIERSRRDFLELLRSQST
jgi:DNA-binding SARP family transcriptional activator